jgi:hypothetical protein
MLPACTADPAVTKTPFGTMKELDDGEFLFSFKRHLLDRAGADRATAVKAHVDAHGLTPARCTNGITVIRSGDAENGYGWALLRCAS